MIHDAEAPLGSPMSLRMVAIFWFLAAIAISQEVFPSAFFALHNVFLFSSSACTASIRAFTVSVLPPSTAPCKAFILFAVSARISAPFDSRNFTMSVCPAIAAQCNGVLPLLSGMSISAPIDTKYSHSSKWPTNYNQDDLA